MRSRHTRLAPRPSALAAAPAALLAILLLASCGGGGGGTSESAATDVTSVSGSVFAGAVAGATVFVKDGAGATVAGPTATAADGSYSVAVPTSTLSGDLLFEASGGTFVDEATGAGTPAGRLRALRPGIASPGAPIHLTPSSTVLADLVTVHGKTRAQATTTVGAAFGFVPDVAVRPANAPAAQAGAASRLAGLRAAAFSQLTHDLGLAAGEQFALLAALGEDLTDGRLDGSAGGAPLDPALPEDVQNRFAQAITAFLGSANNRTELDAGQIGFLPFGTVALTERWRVEYLPVDPGAALGETPFRLRVTRRADGTPAAGLTVTLAPTMHMAAEEHGAPVGAVVDGADGTYACTAYYSMAGGDPYGYWTLEVGIGDGTQETATFHPTVGSPSYATLRGGQEDLVWDEALGDSLKRAYYLFDAGLFEDDPTLGTYRFDVFAAAREDDWSFPPLAPGVQLHDETGAAWIVSTVALEVSLDGATWTGATAQGGGVWSAAGLPGIDPSSEELTFYVRLRVDGVTKTTDGQPLAADGSNGYARLSSGGASCCN